MQTKATIGTLATFTWLGMALFLFAGYCGNVIDPSPPLLECPTSVWDRVDAGTLTREKITQSYQMMRSYECTTVLPDKEPFNSTPVMLFGALTGLLIGCLFLPSRAPRVGHPCDNPACNGLLARRSPTGEYQTALSRLRCRECGRQPHPFR